ncbi:type 3 dihydrofolate reductase [Shewanella sp. SNU WT4]|uniref:type 3 dihydrofolate reductase n=1 Tax=Shewanella sp. SNU WT4 TaxID=2590015 RepID=UPI001129E369|nr:type 3 dihydrofolate reductase [Shewanella sp. SNU WT4]QDF66178.1 type 3 dihydrofolate reductase [Shewanella sp. SNU WT4]
MQIAMIAAMANNRVIGKNNTMPWHLKEDLQHFKAMTLGKPILMGRKTYESIGRALPGRLNIVMTRDASWQAAGVTRVSSFDEAKALVTECDELVVIGGGELYRQLLPQADKLYLTLIDLDVDGDTHFPDWQVFNWAIESEEQHQNDSGIKYRFINLLKQG